MLHLHPTVRELCKTLQEELDERSHPGRLFEGFRSLDRQAELYAQGRTRPGHIVTHTRPGRSIHNYGLAIDMVLFINGKWSWQENGGLWEEMGTIGSSIGFTWGGTWSSFPDRPHFQWMGGLTINDLQNGKFPETDDQEWLNFINFQLTTRLVRKKNTKKILKELGYYDGEIDGIIDNETKKAIKKFQQAEELEDDGIVGPVTWHSLLEKAEETGIELFT